MNQHQQFLHDAQEQLGIGPTEMARRLETNWNTYKAWLYGNNPMPGVAKIAVKGLLSAQVLDE